MWAVRADAHVITTNGSVRKDGAAVMGRGCALEAKRRYLGIEYKLGYRIRRFGNTVQLFSSEALIALPVKHLWHQKADLMLIERSIAQLVALVDETYGIAASIAMPRPGCGNGGLRWADVWPVVASLLDDRFTVCDYAPA